MGDRRKKIMIIDDEVVVCALLKEVVDICGYEPVVCNNPHAALEIYRKMHREINLVLMDLIMPQMGGAQLCKAFMEINPQNKIIILSGYAEADEVESLGQAGVHAFLSKPIEMRHLVRVIEQAVMNVEAEVERS